MEAFHDVLFPVHVAFGATGGPERRNEILQMSSGAEKRNARLFHSRRRYDAGTGVRSLDDLYELRDFFEARRGSLHAFRFRDPLDMKSCHADLMPRANDQVLGIGDGVAASYQLVKTYGGGADAYRREITKPVVASVLISVGGVMGLAGVDYELDAAKGEVHFKPRQVPKEGEIVTAGFEFHVPVRFDMESLSISLTAFKAGQIPSIPLVEVFS